MTDAEFEKLAASVTCCAGPMCCERKIADALRAAYRAGTKEANEPISVLRQIASSAVNANHECYQVSLAKRFLSKLKKARAAGMGG